MAVKIKPTFKIEPKPNHTGYQALGTIKGKFTFLENQTGADTGRGILKTKHGDFPAFVHIKCRNVVRKLYSKSHYFLVWFKNKLITESSPAPIQLTIVGCGLEGIDNTFLVTGALVGGNKETNCYQFVISRNFNSIVPTKRKVCFATRNFKVRVTSSDNLWELYRHKLAALVCQFEDGNLKVISHKLVSDELPDDSILKTFKKKLKAKKKGNRTKADKPLVRKKITVGVIGSEKPKKVLPDVTPTTEPPKRKILELPKK